MKRMWLIAPAILAVAILASNPAPSAQGQTGADPKTRHGEYLVKQVSMCVECHTPRSADGKLLESKLLRGAPIPVTSPPWAKNWALQAPNIAGLSAWTEKQAITFFTTGIRPDGTRANPPMPQFRFNQQDAESLVAYLKRLGSQ